MTIITRRDIEEAERRIRDSIPPSPWTESKHLAAMAACSALYCKLENLQHTGAFKERGALNRLLALSSEERARGVVTASAGNHAQGLAYHAGRLGVKATIVMPNRTPLIKITRTESYGAVVVRTGANFDEAYAHAKSIQETEGRIFIHPFNDPLVIAGQGTIGLELEQLPLDMVVVPIGGGGLISGIACALKERKRGIKVIGVQAEAIASMKASWDARHLEGVRGGPTLADGIAVRWPGDLTWEMVRENVDDIVLVDEEEIANAILLFLEQHKMLIEGAGAVGLAALINGKIPAARGCRVAVVISGGNIDANIVSRIIERGLERDGRLVRLVIRLQDTPGQLAKLTEHIGAKEANVLGVDIRSVFSKKGLWEGMVTVRLETRGHAHIQELMGFLLQNGWEVTPERREY